MVRTHKDKVGKRILAVSGRHLVHERVTWPGDFVDILGNIDIVAH